MLNVLYAIEAALPRVLRDGKPWNALLVNYHPPSVERLWRQVGEYRVSLHRIHPCDPREALFHPHPWPSAVRLVEGSYEMAIGYGTTHEEPPVAARVVLSAPDAYEMVNPDGWHAVVPLDRASYSLMVSGKPWRQRSPDTVRHPLKPLEPCHRNAILEFFRRRYAF